MVGCKREVAIKEGPFQVDPAYGGPEYETVGAVGSLCGVDDLAAVCKANELCQRLGLDTIATGNVIAFAMECFEKGFLTLDDTDGVDLSFGNAASMVSMVEKIGRREGFGRRLGEGVARVSQELGPETAAFAMHVRGQEFPMHEPRGKAMLSLHYTLSPTGACHVEGPHDPAYEKDGPGFETFRLLDIHEAMPREELSERKARAFAQGQHTWKLFNSVGMCVFCGKPGGFVTLPDLVGLVNASAGWDLTLEDLVAASDRHRVMARLLNLRSGMTKADDVLPQRMFEPLESGSRAGRKLDREEFLAARQVAYEQSGWDEDGVPTEATLDRLGMAWAKPMLEEIKAGA
jgi:aldehyde:ferredoxin oxidoreductase